MEKIKLDREWFERKYGIIKNGCLVRWLSKTGFSYSGVLYCKNVKYVYIKMGS